MAGGRTLLQQSETFTGVLIPFIGSTLIRTRAGFVAMNEALARQATRTATQGHGSKQAPVTGRTRSTPNDRPGATRPGPSG